MEPNDKISVFEKLNKQYITISTFLAWLVAAALQGYYVFGSLDVQGHSSNLDGYESLNIFLFALVLLNFLITFFILAFVLVPEHEQPLTSVMYPATSSLVVFFAIVSSLWTLRLEQNWSTRDVHGNFTSKELYHQDGSPLEGSDIWLTLSIASVAIVAGYLTMRNYEENKKIIVEAASNDPQKFVEAANNDPYPFYGILVFDSQPIFGPTKDRMTKMEVLIGLAHLGAWGLAIGLQSHHAATTPSDADGYRELQWFLLGGLCFSVLIIVFCTIIKGFQKMVQPVERGLFMVVAGISLVSIIYSVNVSVTKQQLVASGENSTTITTKTTTSASDDDDLNTVWYASGVFALTALAVSMAYAFSEKKEVKEGGSKSVGSLASLRSKSSGVRQPLVPPV